MAKIGLGVNFPAGRVEARLYGGGMEVGGGEKLEARETVEKTGAGNGGGAAGGANGGRGATGAGGT